MRFVMRMSGVLLIASMIFAASVVRADAEIPAFPGAEGFGSSTPGGRGGRVIEVTNLNPDGPGSLREACSAKGPPSIKFRYAEYPKLLRIVPRNHPIHHFNQYEDAQHSIFPLTAISHSAELHTLIDEKDAFSFVS